MDAYLKSIRYDVQKEEEDFKTKAENVKSHEISKRVSEIKVMGGGKDLSGNKENDVIGGFGDEKLRSPKELAAAKK